MQPRGNRHSIADREIQEYESSKPPRPYAQESVLAIKQSMDRYNQLSQEALLELVDDFQRGLKAKQRLKENPNVSRSERKRLQVAINRGDYAIEHIIGSSFKLAWLIAKEHAESRVGPEKAISIIPDLVAEANLGVVEASRTFNTSRKIPFTSFLARTMRDKVRSSTPLDVQVHIPPSWVRLKRIATMRIPALQDSLGRKPTVEEIQQDLLAYSLEWAEAKLSVAERSLSTQEKYDIKIAKLKKQGMLAAIRNVTEVLSIDVHASSLNAPVYSDGNATVSEVLPAPTVASLFDDLELRELAIVLRQSMSELQEREQQILRYRFGFEDGTIWTYAAIAEKYGITAERIRQIEYAVLAKLSSSKSSTTLESFLRHPQH